MKTLIATLSISAALLAPVATFADTPTVPTATPATPAPVAATTVPTKNQAGSPRLAMNEQNPTVGKQARDDREGLSRIVEQTRQLGATN